MTIKITALELTISGKDLELLSDACELARVHIEQNKNNSHVAGYSAYQVNNIKTFIGRVFSFIPEGMRK